MESTLEVFKGVLSTLGFLGDTLHKDVREELTEQ